MSKIARFAVLVASLASLFAVMSSTAGAVTWHNTGSTSFTAHGTGGTLSASGINLSCTTATATGTAAGGSTVAAVYNVSGSLTFSPCSLAGTAAHVACTYTLTGTTFASPVTSGNADVHCTAKLVANNTNLCTIHGATAGTYTNPSGTTAGKLTVSSSSTLKVTNASPDTCPLGNNINATLSEQTFTVTGGTPTALGPVLNRTA